MKLFSRQDTSSSTDIQAPLVNYDSALEFICGLSEEDYSKFSHVAIVMRFADQREREILGLPDKPTSWIAPHRRNEELIAAHINHIDPKSKTFMDDDDDADIAAILESEEPSFIEDDLPIRRAKAETVARMKKPLGTQSKKTVKAEVKAG